MGRERKDDTGGLFQYVIGNSQENATSTTVRYSLLSSFTAALQLYSTERDRETRLINVDQDYDEQIAMLNTTKIEPQQRSGPSILH